jgi:hypothetical protein
MMLASGTAGLATRPVPAAAFSPFLGAPSPAPPARGAPNDRLPLSVRRSLAFKTFVETRPNGPHTVAVRVTLDRSDDAFVRAKLIQDKQTLADYRQSVRLAPAKRASNSLPFLNPN